MKKTFVGLTIMLTCLLNLNAGEASESWARLYTRVADINQKYSVMQNIRPLDDPSLEPFLSSALDDLIYGELSQYRTVRASYDSWERLTRTVVREIGDIKAQSAVRAVWDLVRTAETPLLKAEGMMCLGELRAAEYAPELATMLRNLNFNTRTDKQAAEIEAYGAVAALDKMKDPAGVEPLFYASIGWYSDRVTDYAAAAVLTVMADPTQEFMSILENAQDYHDKRDALKTALATQAPDSGKVEVATLALKEGLKYAETDIQLRRELALLRMEAIEALIAIEAGGNPETPGLLDSAIDEGNLDEKLLAVQALGIDGSDAAVEILTNRLEEYNQRQLDGLAINREEQTLVRGIVYSLGEAANQNALTALKQMAFAEYTPAMIRAAEESIAKISGQ